MAAPVKPGLRDRKRAEIEQRLLDAATKLFVRDGYVATTLAAVADHAGVAARTVYGHFPTKADLLRRCIGVAIGGDTADVRLADRDWMREAMTAPTRRDRIRLMAAVTAGLMERAGPLLRVAQQAEPNEPEIAAAAAAGRADTRRNLGAFWRGMADDGLLPANCDVDWLAETATLLAYPDTYLLLENTAAWDVPAYEAWLVTTWTRLVQASNR